MVDCKGTKVEAERIQSTTKEHPLPLPALFSLEEINFCFFRSTGSLFFAEWPMTSSLASSPFLLMKTRPCKFHRAVFQPLSCVLSINNYTWASQLKENELTLEVYEE